MQQLLINKYFSMKSLTQTQGRPGDSHFWAGLMKVKDDFLKWGHFLVQDGSKTRFWKDVWLESMPLSEQFVVLYNVARWKEVTVREVFLTGSLNLIFHRMITGDKLTEWNKMTTKIAKVRLSSEVDSFVWNLHSNGKFSVASMYNEMLVQANYPLLKPLWKMKIPLKIKIFVWYLGKGVTLTKDNLSKRKWKGINKCSFCNNDETIQHIFFNCHVARVIWQIVNIATGIPKPNSIRHILVEWITSIRAKEKHLILVGVAAMFWSIWLCRYCF
jgi:hypothetical protein